MLEQPAIHHIPPLDRFNWDNCLATPIIEPLENFGGHLCVIFILFLIKFTICKMILCLLFTYFLKFSLSVHFTAFRLQYNCCHQSTSYFCDMTTAFILYNNLKYDSPQVLLLHEDVSFLVLLMFYP